MSAMQRGWERGRSEAADPAAGVGQDAAAPDEENRADQDGE
jgi:hypothetical protein